MNGRRVISGIVLIILTVVLFFAGGPVLLVGLFLLSIGGLYEYASVLSEGLHQGEKVPVIRPLRITSMILSLAWFLLVYYAKDVLWNGHLVLYFIFGTVIVLMILGVFLYPGRWFADISATFFGLVYISLFFSTIYLIRTSASGQFYVWFLVAASWGSDVFAYYTGMTFGRHKMTPKLSPHKTVEGAIGGILGGIILCLLYGMIITKSVGVDRAVMLKMSLLIGLVGSIAAGAGDLFASSIKRVMKIKDYSSLIPGHGGILDRFDSVLLAAPVVLILLDLFKAI